MLNRTYKIYLILFFLLLFFHCGKDIKVRIDNNKKYIKKNLNNKLIINLKSNKDSTLKVAFVLHDLTDDVTDMPIFEKELVVHPGENYYVILLKEIGSGKYGLRLYYHKDLLDYRILDISP